VDIYLLIDQLEGVIATGRRIPLTDVVVLERARLFELIDRLRVAVPDDVKEAQRILQQRDQLLLQAQREADRLIGQAEEEVRSRVEATDVVHLAHQRATELVDQAEMEAQRLREEAQAEASRKQADADRYAMDVLQGLDAQLASVLASVRRGIDELQKPGP